MAMDSKGNNHKAVGRPDGGQSTAKPDKTPTTTWTSMRSMRAARVFDRIVAGDDDGVDPETARRIRYAIRLAPDPESGQGLRQHATQRRRLDA